jgi:hypothetical protein
VTSVAEHAFEPIRGLPEDLPEGEVILWQGAPVPASLAIRAFHLKALAAYFGLLAAWRGGALAMDGAPAIEAVAGAAWLVLLGAAAGLICGLFGYFAARTTVYTITNRRLVFRVGVALPLTLNIPFRAIHSAGVRVHGDGTGDIVLSLTPPHKIAYLMLWPHARPWRFSRPEPMLRSLKDPAVVAQLLSRALAGAALLPSSTVPVVQADGGAMAPAGGEGSATSAAPRAAAAA